VKYCRLLVCALLLCLVASAGPTPEQLFKDAQKAEKSGQTVRAYLLYAEAAAADPTNVSYWERAQALRPLASLLKSSEPAAMPEMPADKIDRTLFGTIGTRDIEQARTPLPPPQLSAVPGRRDFDIRGDSKSLWEQVAKTLGLMIVFDTQYQPTKIVRFQLTDADYRETFRALEAATDSFLTPVSERLIFVANDNPQKRTEFEGTAAVVIPFPETATVQELQELTVGVRGVLDIQKLMVDSQRKLILIRDRVVKVRLAEKLLLDLMRPRPQVAVEVEILAMDKTSSLSYGLTAPTAFPLVSFIQSKYLSAAVPQGFTQFLTFGGGASLLGIGITSAQLFANVAKASATTLLNGEIVAMDGLPSTLHVGDKYPIITNGYFGASSGSGQVFTPPPTFTFEDLGLLLKITPHVHGDDEVSLDIDAEFKLLGAGAVDGIPIISNRKYESKIRVRNGEWAVIAGLISGSEARTITGIPGMSSVPFLRSNKVTTDHSETLIVLKPHLLILPPTETATWRAWVGTETKLPGNY
jgi:general secretion pathway protein D